MNSTDNQLPQLMNGNEDVYKSEGRIELKIEKLTGFIQEPLNTRRHSEPFYVRGMACGISAKLHECGEAGQKQKCLGYYLICLGCIDPAWSCSITANMQVLAQKKDEEGAKAVDHVKKLNKVFNAEERIGGFAQYMTFGELMNPDRGWYDAQADSITLAADFTMDAAERIGKYVLVARNEFTLNKVPTSFSIRIDQLEWQVDYEYDDQKRKEGGKSLVLSCKDVAKAKADNVLLELFGYRRDDPKYEMYSEFSEKSVRRHLFTSKDNSLTIKIPGGSAYNNLLFIVQVSKERSQFPDFTNPAAIVGRFSADVKLRVGDQQFHVNRQLLSSHSLFFDRMFLGDYTAATQQEVELSLITHSPELFHHFLLVLCVSEVLPHFVNVTALFKLADFYDAENVNKKCDQYIRMAREMSIEKRVLLARDHGSSETQDMIVDSANLEEFKHITRLFMQNRTL